MNQAGQVHLAGLRVLQQIGRDLRGDDRDLLRCLRAESFGLREGDRQPP
jgi:hypothetical protein